jgi:glycine/D-amino acid oxidase-like deaminating enzyme
LIAKSHAATPEPDFSDNDQDRIDPAFDYAHGIENYGYALLEELAEFAPDLADCGGIAATTSGFYGMTPDATPLIGVDAQQPNLVHAAGFSGHGLMHAPITALLVEAIIAGDAREGRVRLPLPFAEHSIALAAFDPARDFARSTGESQVL